LRRKWKTLWFWFSYSDIIAYDEDVNAIYGIKTFNTLEDAQKFIFIKKKYDKVTYHEKIS